MAAPKNITASKSQTVWSPETDRKLLLYLLPSSAGIDKEQTAKYMGVTRPSLEARLHRLRKERDAVKAGDPATIVDATRGGSEAAAADAKTKKTLHDKKGKAGAIKQKRKAEDDEDDEEGPKKKIKQSESDNDADIDGEVADGQKGI